MGLQDDIPHHQGIRRLTEQGRIDGGGTAGDRPLLPDRRRLRRKLVRAVDRSDKVQELETLYDVVHDEVEGTALDVAAALRSVRRGNGMLGRVRRLLVPSR